MNDKEEQELDEMGGKKWAREKKEGKISGQ